VLPGRAGGRSRPIGRSGDRACRLLRSAR
jgi:hypothetical protein